MNLKCPDLLIPFVSIFVIVFILMHSVADLIYASFTLILELQCFWAWFANIDQMNIYLKVQVFFKDCVLSFILFKKLVF